MEGLGKAMERYITLAKLDTHSSDYRREIFMYHLDHSVTALVDTLPFAQESDKDDLDKVIEQLEAHFDGQTNEIYEAFQFFSRKQGDGETLSQYITAVKKLALKCNFGSLRD